MVLIVDYERIPDIQMASVHFQNSITPVKGSSLRIPPLLECVSLSLHHTSYEIEIGMKIHVEQNSQSYNKSTKTKHMDMAGVESTK